MTQLQPTRVKGGCKALFACNGRWFISIYTKLSKHVGREYPYPAFMR